MSAYTSSRSPDALSSHADHARATPERRASGRALAHLGARRARGILQEPAEALPARAPLAIVRRELEVQRALPSTDARPS